MLVTCGGCHKKLNIEDHLGGQLGRCPACDSVIQLPTADQTAGRLPDDPLPEAPVVPDPELLSLAPADQTGEGKPAPPPARTPPTGTTGIPTDQEGFVLAVPVEEDDAGQAPGAIPGQGTVVARPGEGAGDAGYALRDEEQSPAPPVPTSTSGVVPESDLATSLDEVLGQLDSDQGAGAPPSPVPSGRAGAAGGPQAAPADKIITRCPGCGGLLGIEAQYAGGMRTCPKCTTEIQVPLQSTVLLPEAGAPQRAAGPGGAFPVVPDADAADLSPEVDMDAYVAEPVVISTRAVGSYWIVLAFLVGATIGFVAGWILEGYYTRPAPPAVEPSPPVQVDQPE